MLLPRIWGKLRRFVPSKRTRRGAQRTSGHAHALPSSTRASSSSPFPRVGGEDLFNYTSGRWIYNESRRLAERHFTFDVQELKRLIAAAVNRSEQDVHSLTKLAEGGFNRTFQATMVDGLEVIARLPYPSTLPKRYAVASEVATMDLVRAHGLPAPRILDYSVTSENSLRSEYIIMEKAQGREIGHSWYNLSKEERKSIGLDVTKVEASLFGIKLPAYGSVYYKRDLAPSDHSIDIPDSDGLCIGPDASLEWWYDNRGVVEVDRGPFLTATQVMEAGARRELEWLKKHGRSRYSFDRHYREILQFQKSDPGSYVKSLEKYLLLSHRLVPESDAFTRPTIRHPDLQPHNLFVSDDFRIVSLIDWQHCSVLPLFLLTGAPKYWQNRFDHPVVLDKPDLPNNFDQLSENEKAQEIDKLKQRQNHLFYLSGTQRHNPTHMDAYLEKGVIFKRRLFEHASAPWEGDNATLEADLVLAWQNWDALTVINNTAIPDCPISFTAKEAAEILSRDDQLKEADSEMEDTREMLGISSDGWVPHEHYDITRQNIAMLKQQLVEQETDETAKKRAADHFPFDDFDEEA